MTSKPRRLPEGWQVVIDGSRTEGYTWEATIRCSSIRGTGRATSERQANRDAKDYLRGLRGKEVSTCRGADELAGRSAGEEREVQEVRGEGESRSVRRRDNAREGALGAVRGLGVRRKR